MDRKVFRREEASAYLLGTWGVSYRPATLAKLATVGGGPRFAHIGRWPVYKANDLDEWISKRLSPLKTSTSDQSYSFSRSSVDE